MNFTAALSRAYHELIRNPSNKIQFWILAGFLPTFLIARLIVDTTPQLYLAVHGTHVHHFAYGIIVLAITGFVSLIWPKFSRPVLALFYGIGLALAFDEFGMWIRLTSNYHLGDSEDVMVGILLFLLLIVYGIDLLRHTASYLRH
jgi:hypothetical protein